MNPESFGQIEGLFDAPLEVAPLLDQLPLGIMILSLDQKILFLNSAFEALTGFDRDEVHHVPCCHVLRTDICNDRCPILNTGDSVKPAPQTGTILISSREKIDVRLTASALRDRNGRIIGYMETVEDLGTHHQIMDHQRDLQGFSQIVGRSPPMQKLFSLVPVVAQTDSSLLITGETGTGKDILAEAIHETSDRSDGPFIKVNCGALPETLLESELFGHKKGAFTGAESDKMGRVRLAHNGTLYLTEIGDLSLPLQVKLLTFLDDKIVYPLGDADGYHVDVRIIAATHRDLMQMTRDNAFRQDLLFRLNVVRFHLPPLRERDGDVRLLLDHFLKIFSVRFGKSLKGFTRTAQELLLNYAYPGNVRELRNIVEYSTSICPVEMIGLEHLPAYLGEPLLDVGGETGDVSHVEEPVSWSSKEAAPGMNWAAIERQLIVDTLVKAKGHRSRAAEMLGWGRSTLWRKMKFHGLES